MRPPADGGTIPDLLFCFAAAGWTMAIILAAAAFANRIILAGGAGQVIALLFAAALAISGVFLFLVGMLLLNEGRNNRDHYLTPILLGVIMGAIEAVLFLEPAGLWPIAPIAIIVLALRPVRRSLARMAGQQQGRPSHR